ncbi:MAG: class I SAM-dependent methyltransferase [Candidatus Levybacteria bacterium]|nr:class I SAM-dependent methyltransferase [Candidatus Levybacteria bacterium]
MIDKIGLSSSMDVLEIGCGRGDSALYIAKKAHSVFAIDYSKDAIEIASNMAKRYPSKIRNKVKFTVMRADNLKFQNNSFDVIIFIDTIDHLNKKEINNTFKEILRVLKPRGFLFIKTCSNKILLDKTYKYYIWPMNEFLTWLDKKIKKTSYTSLPWDPRTAEAKKQHINEPDYFYLKSLFKKHNLKGNIKSETGFLTKNKGFRSELYNFVVGLYPLSKYFPLNILFAHSFFAELVKNE